MILYCDKEQLQKILSEVKHADAPDFYRTKFSDIAATANLEEIPMLTRAEFSSVDPADRLYVQPERVSFVGYTSGTTTGEPLINYFAEVENYFFSPSLEQDVSRLLITYPPLNKNFGASFIQQCRQAEHPVLPIFADYQNLANSAVIAKRTKPDALYATPTIALQLADYLDQHHTTQDIKLVAVSSEVLTETKRLELERRYPNARIANLYASSEIGQFLLYPCRHMLETKTQAFHFLHEALIALEIVDDELVVTCAQNKAFPLIRYKTGDRFTVHEEVCGCGDTHNTLELIGRDGVDVVRVHGFEVRAGSVDAFFAALPQSVVSYQLHFNEGESEGSFTLTIEVVVPDGAVVDVLHDTFLDSFYFAHKKSARFLLEQGILDSITVVPVTRHSSVSTKHKVLVSHIQ